MRVEIERKAWVRDVEGLRNALEARYGQPRETLKNDRYYIEPGAELTEDPTRAPKVVRLRREGTFAIVTSKQRKFVEQNEVNREIEFIIDDPEAFEEFIHDYLGFEILVDKVKHTWTFREEELTLELSELQDLGWFFEVEYIGKSKDETPAAAEWIDSVFERFKEYLGNVETAQYIVLLLRKAGRLA